MQERTKDLTSPIKIAILGCAVNGPGEAREADIGVAGGRGHGIIFRNGEVIRRCTEAELVGALMEEVEILVARSVELRELLAEFGLVLHGFDPGVEVYFADQHSRYPVNFDHTQWTWLEPLLKELRELRTMNIDDAPDELCCVECGKLTETLTDSELCVDCNFAKNERERDPQL